MNIKDPIWAIFSDEERTFLNTTFSKPEVAEKRQAIAANFERYLQAPPPRRAEMAENDLQEILRTGWVIRGVPNPENIRIHTGYVERHALKEAPDGVNGQRCVAMASIHDIPEAIITDLLPGDPVSKDERTALGRLAMKAIYHGSPHLAEVLDLFDEFEKQETPESHWVHDVDKLDPVFVALQYEGKYPDLQDGTQRSQGVGLFQEFADYAGKRLKTEKGRSIFDEVVENQAQYRTSYRAAFEATQNTERSSWAGRE